MRRPHVLTACAAVLMLVPQLAFADVVDKVVGQLRAQGYTSIDVSRTWLGRIQIEAGRPGEEREIVLNRQTGEILRDYWRKVARNGGDGDDSRDLLDTDDDYDDDDDDDGDDDNSGGNSGPGGGDDDDDDDDDDNSGSGGGDDDD